MKSKLITLNQFNQMKMNKVHKTHIYKINKNMDNCIIFNKTFANMQDPTKISIFLLIIIPLSNLIIIIEMSLMI